MSIVSGSKRHSRRSAAVPGSMPQTTLPRRAAPLR